MRVRGVFLFLALLLLAGCMRGERVDVLASIYPLEFAASWIAGGALSVGLLVPGGIEPHDYELSARDFERIESSRLVLLQGGGLEVFSDEVERWAKSKGVEVVRATEGLELLTTPSGVPDPHSFLDPALFSQEVERIRDALIRLEPSRRELFENNSKTLQDELRALDERFKSSLSSCRNPKILTTHRAFGYWASRYNFTSFALSGMDPDSEPSPRTLEEASRIARTEGIRVVFVEPLFPSGIAEALALEIGGKVRVLDPLESPPKEGTYLEVMEKNRKELVEAMECGE